MIELILSDNDILVLSKSAVEKWGYPVPRDWFEQLFGVRMKVRAVLVKVDYYVEFETDQDMVEFKLKWL